MTKRIAILLAGFFGCGRDDRPIAKPEPAPLTVTPAALDAWADQQLGKLPSAVIGVVDASGLRWARGVGERAPGSGRPDRTTVYRIGSVTKLLTGTALLQLVEKGTLTLDDPVTRWIPELSALSKVTLRHLVTHTSGIPSIGDGTAIYWEQQPPDRAALLRAVAAAPAWEPGSRSEYSNAGMALVGEVIARATKSEYRAYTNAAILAPLGMRTAVWDRSAVLEKRLALGSIEARTDPPHWELGAFEAAGGLYASLDDMTAFARFALGAPPHILGDEARNAAQSDDPLPGEHGVAWIAGGTGRTRFAAHTGSTMDYSAALVVLPEAGFAAIVLASGSDAELVECAAFAAVTATATATPLVPCRSEIDDATRAAASATLDRLLVVLADPQPAAITAAFEPAFLAKIPAAQIVEIVGQLRGEAGACKSYVVTDKGGAGVRGKLRCEKRDLAFELAPSHEHRIAGLRFTDL
jgi:CubicO group peptidase (beta-lactamase class C family)